MKNPKTGPGFLDQVLTLALKTDFSQQGPDVLDNAEGP